MKRLVQNFPATQNPPLSLLSVLINSEGLLKSPSINPASFQRMLKKFIPSSFKAHQIPVEAEDLAKLTITNLVKWHAPADSLIAASIAPFIEHDAVVGTSLVDTYKHEEGELARQLIKWHESLSVDRSTLETESQYRATLLRQLYRQAYLDLPNLSLLMLLLAEHDARLSMSKNDDQKLALLTKDVFLPLADMLGFWHLYRKWTENTYALLFADEYAEMARLLGRPESYSHGAFEELLSRRNSIKEKGGASSQERQWLSDNKFLFDKATAFLHLKDTLGKQLKVKGVRARLMLIGNLPGLALRRVHEGESKDDVAARLSIRVLCQTVDDCYKMLGIVHELGTPVSFTAHIHFKDYIASPQSNGYKALHAAIIYRRHRGDRGGKIIVEFRILTMDMYWLNEYGVSAALHRRKIKNSDMIKAWWTDFPKLTGDLQRRFGGESYSSVEHLLKENALASTSNPIYVFTPRGEIVLLDQGSTALDYAYSIHTDVGHHAMKIEVNGQVVPHGYPLRNGDIVLVHYDPHFAGPDLTWLGFVATRSAKASIRRGLTKIANSSGEGRKLIEDALLKILNFYRREKGFVINITTGRLDNFLMRRFKFYGCMSIDELYTRVKDKSIAADSLVWSLISDELSPGVLTGSGGRLPYPSYLTSLCNNCCPAPGEAIIGYEHVISDTSKKLVIHCIGDYVCTQSANPSRSVALTWAEYSDKDGEIFLVFNISGEDRRGLLHDVLDIVYQASKVSLHKVDARVDKDGHAEMVLVVKSELFSQLNDIKSQMINIPGVNSISSSMPAPSQQWNQARMASPTLGGMSAAYKFLNPYTTDEVYTRSNFYDREELLKGLLEWLDEPPPIPSMILHGQRRVGKSSLVKYLINEILPQQQQNIVPVYVDLQGLDEFSSIAIAKYIAEKVYGAIQQAIPERKTEGALRYLNHAIREALKQHPRLLLIVDEFNVLMDVERRGLLGQQIYNNLRSVMNEQRAVNWLLVIQDTHFLDPDEWLSAGPLLQKIRKLQVKHLDLDWARKLILDPARRCGITPRDNDVVANKIFELTDGSPYLINIIGFELVRWLRHQNRTNITADDINHVVDLITFEGELYFDHFIRNLNGVKKVVMASVATLCAAHGVADGEAAFDLIRSRTRRISAQSFRKNIQALTQEGLIEVKVDEADRRRHVSIPIGLFKKFICQYVDLNDAVEEWLAMRSVSGGTKNPETN